MNVGTLDNKYVNTFNSSQAASLNSKLFECVEKSVAGKLISPKDLWGSTEWQPLIHLTWTDHLWGFMNDVYIETYLNKTADPLYAVINFQSEARVGATGDPHSHVSFLMKCMNNALSLEKNTYLAPCSL